MRKVIIGHRGAGKTSFLKRHQDYLAEGSRAIPHLDLDQEIETRNQIKIQKYFEEKGEPQFRQLEKATFNTLISENKEFVISAGAGFDLSLIPQDIEVLFVSRVTDELGRIFLNRPRLNPQLTALDEFKERYQARQKNYLSAAKSIYFMSEGVEEMNELERALVRKDFLISDAYYTLVEKEAGVVGDIKKNYAKIELRTDLIAVETIQKLIQEDPGFDWLVSIRQEIDPQSFGPVLIDCDVSLTVKQQIINDTKSIISCHLDSIQSGIEALRPYTANHLKLSPIVESFDDLIKGYNWQIQDRSKRSFLPRSADGKWLWFRQLGKYLQKINFVRNFTMIKDQPSTYQWLTLPAERPKHFAAVLGQPVVASRSPETHREYFKKQGSFFTAIDIDEANFVEYIVKLNELGLKFAAVTSPLKFLAFQVSAETTELASKLRSVNTLIFKNRRWHGHNTDFAGFKDLISRCDLTTNDKIAVWGGGGTLAMMQNVLTDAQYFSSRSGEMKDLKQVKPDYSPEVVIWSAPRLPETQFPPKEWKPRVVIDLNYLEQSMGLEYAQKIGCKYVSGLAMFKKQAEEQQKFWSPS